MIAMMVEAKGKMDATRAYEHTTDGSIDAAARASYRKLLWKIDLWILPVLSFLFLLSFLDKVNIANAKVFYLTRDLHLQGNDFNTALVIYFVAYVVFNLPATIVLRKVKPHIWLSACMFCFGIICMLQGFVSNLSGLLAVRFFLGIAEASSFSCCFYLLGMWYQREEAQRRFTFFYGSVQMAGAFGGLLASAIGLLDGHEGYSGWRWIFIIEGACTAAISIPFFFIIPDFPSQTTWLSPSEKAALLSHIHHDPHSNSSEGDPITLKVILTMLSEPKILIAGLMYFALIIPGYSYAYFAPSIIKSYTDTPIHTNLLSVPPWVCGFTLAMTLAYLSDRTRHRFLFATLPLLLLAIPALAILLSIHDRPHVQYAALFLLVMGLWSSLPILVCWGSMNVAGHARRSIATGWLIGFGNAGGIPAVYLFLETEAPGYAKGYGVALAFVGATVLLAGVYAGICWRENRVKERCEGGGGRAEKSQSEFWDDRSLAFRNIL